MKRKETVTERTKYSRESRIEVVTVIEKRGYGVSAVARIGGELL